ncbi:c6a39a5c-02e2-4d91-ad65-24a9cdbd1e68 [Thermothielavioides terrestris]|nr:c6a39a5c-02e2-4d91-ad65-24a9cdbd1e68 [Thermothielavioides terrestris]
MSIQRI